MSKITKRGLLAALGVLAVAAIGGLAYAYWTGTGTGSGTGTVGTSGSVVLSGSVASGIAPGTSEPVSFTAANSSSAATQVTTVHLVSVVADAGHGACATADFSMADVTENHQVPAGATVDPLPNAGTLAYANTAVSQDGCKGATLTLTLSST